MVGRLNVAVRLASAARGIGWVGSLRLISATWIWMSGGGDLRHPRVRHAGDTPLEGFAWRKSPRWVDSSHVVSPQACGKRRADLRNELVWMLQIMPADTDDVPALGLKVALALALAGK